MGSLIQELASLGQTKQGAGKILRSPFTVQGNYLAMTTLFTTVSVNPQDHNLPYYTNVGAGEFVRAPVGGRILKILYYNEQDTWTSDVIFSVLINGVETNTSFRCILPVASGQIGKFETPDNQFVDFNAGDQIRIRMSAGVGQLSEINTFVCIISFNDIP